MIVLSEVASRALSPAVNDPGTAIDIIGTSVRVLAPWLMNENSKSEIQYPKIHVPIITIADLFDDIFTGIARDGAGTIEVGIRLQKAFAALAEIGGNDECKEQAKIHSALALKRAFHALPVQEDKDRLASYAL